MSKAKPPKKAEKHSEAQPHKEEPKKKKARKPGKK